MKIYNHHFARQLRGGCWEHVTGRGWKQISMDRYHRMNSVYYAKPPGLTATECYSRLDRYDAWFLLAVMVFVVAFCAGIVGAAVEVYLP